MVAKLVAAVKSFAAAKELEITVQICVLFVLGSCANIRSQLSTHKIITCVCKDNKSKTLKIHLLFIFILFACDMFLFVV